MSIIFNSPFCTANFTFCTANFTFCTANFTFCTGLELIDVFLANQNEEIVACILLPHSISVHYEIYNKISIWRAPIGLNSVLYESTKHEVHVNICKMANDFPNFSPGIPEELRQQFPFDKSQKKTKFWLQRKRAICLQRTTVVLKL